MKKSFYFNLTIGMLILTSFSAHSAEKTEAKVNPFFGRIGLSHGYDSNATFGPNSNTINVFGIEVNQTASQQKNQTL